MQEESEQLPEFTSLSLPEDTARERKRPDISPLADAIVDGEPQFRVGDRIVIDRVTLDSRRAWFDTRVYEVLEMDPNGRLSLWDVEKRHHALSDFVKGPQHGYTFKLTIPAAVVETVEIQVDPPVKRGRGRPPGSKNRPKEVIKAEKREKLKKWGM